MAQCVWHSEPGPGRRLSATHELFTGDVRGGIATVHCPTSFSWRVETSGALDTYRDVTRPAQVSVWTSRPRSLCPCLLPLHIRRASFCPCHCTQLSQKPVAPGGGGCHT